jgi:ABC-type multidrug transport system fused ATPase/permease subunit
MRYLWPYRLTALGAFVGLMISSLASLAGPRILAWGVDDGVKALDLAVVWKSCALLVGVAAGRSVFGFLQGYWSEVASQGVAFDLRNAIYDKLQRLSFSYHDQAQTGKLMTRVTSDVEQVRQFVGVGLLQLVSALVLLVGSAVILLRANWQLALAALSVVPFIFAVLGGFIMRVRPRFGAIQRKLGALNTVLQENLAGAKVVHAFAAEPLESERFTVANRSLVEEWQGLIKVFSTSFPLIFFFSNLGTLLVFWLGGAKVIVGEMSVGQVIAFNLYLSLLLMPIFILGGLAAGLSRAGASAGRLFEVMDADDRLAQRVAQRVGDARADEQRAGEARPLGAGDGVERRLRRIRLGQHRLDQRHEPADVIARREFRHHAAVARVQVDLRMQPVREQPRRRVVDGDAGFVAGGFDAEDAHGIVRPGGPAGARRSWRPCRRPLRRIVGRSDREGSAPSLAGLAQAPSRGYT